MHFMLLKTASLDTQSSLLNKFIKYRSTEKEKWLPCKIYREEGRSRRGQKHGGRCFNKQTVINILTNPVYIGRIRYGDQVYDGRHPDIVTEGLFNKVQQILNGARVKRRSATRTGDHVYLLKSLLKCGRCGAAMVPGCAYGRGSKR